MKTKITALVLATTAALSFTPKPAAASDKGLAIVGGFIGGLIVASAINDSYHDYPARTAVIVNDGCEPYASNGYWRDVTVQVWVPACWVVERGYRGSDHRRYVAGHYEGRNNRVWVSNVRHDHHDRDSNHGRGRR
jgi:hypothetical protein